MINSRSIQVFANGMISFFVMGDVRFFFFLFVQVGLGEGLFGGRGALGGFTYN